MPKIQECTSIRSDIISVSDLNNGLFAYSTKHHGARILSADECSTTVNIVDKNLNYQTSTVSFSKDIKLLAFTNSNLIYIYDITNKQTVKTIKTDKELVELLEFDPGSQYLFAGTKSGRVLQYSSRGGSVLSRICSFSHKANSNKSRSSFVSALAFYNNKIACSGYGGLIYIVDIFSHANKNIITEPKSSATSLCFIDDNLLISGHLDGSLNIHSLKDKKLLKKLDMPFLKVSKILFLKN